MSLGVQVSVQKPIVLNTGTSDERFFYYIVVKGGELSDVSAVLEKGQLCVTTKLYSIGDLIIYRVVSTLDPLTLKEVLESLPTDVEDITDAAYAREQRTLTLV